MSDPANPNPNSNPNSDPGTAASSGTVASTGTVDSTGTVGGPGSVLGGEATAEAAYDPEKITLPEGFEKGEVLEEFSNIAKELGLSQPKAQSLIDLHAKVSKAAMDKIYGDWDKQQVAWQKEVSEDKELGGQNLDVVKQTVSKLLDNPELSDPKFREALVFTGAGNNPAIIRTLYRWAKALSEGGMVAGSPAARDGSGNTSANRPSAAEALYGPSGPHSGGPKLS